MKVGFIGTGNMGGALATAASRADNVELVLANKPECIAESLAKKIGGIVKGNLDVAKECDIIFLGVKPDILDVVGSEIRDTLAIRKKEFLIVSMIAGKSLSQIEAAYGRDNHIIRILPNVSVMVGEGLIMYKANEMVTENQLIVFKRLMENAGRLSEQEEALIPAGAGISGCGPAFAAMFIEAMADGGVVCGLSRKQSIEYAAQMVKGTAEYVLQKDIHPEALKDSVTSPGGTTIQGVRTLEQNGFRSALIEAVIATMEKDLTL